MMLMSLEKMKVTMLPNTNLKIKLHKKKNTHYSIAKMVTPY